MANQYHLSLLQEGSNLLEPMAWSITRNTARPYRSRLSGIDLKGANLSEANLTQAILNEACLQERTLLASHTERL